jgi:hypothetical protein
LNTLNTKDNSIHEEKRLWEEAKDNGQRKREVQTKEKARAGWGLLLSPPREKLPVWA